MSLTSGTKLGPYEIDSPLGAGGMGEVYRARDTRLGRDVALKVLPESFARDTARLQRFQQEARAVAALSHPNILAVFDTGQNNGSPFLVSELLEGETLRSVLERGPLWQRKAIEYGVQIAQGLAAAHERGIVHRDLKPDNIFVTRDGRIKILDFGLAKMTQKASAEEADAVTLTSSHTAAGVVLGTVNYMSPEQVRGEPADARSDIFAFGAVLYEMLSGQRAFRRDTTAETMTAVLREDPPELTEAQRISPAIDRIVRRCLEKSPDERFQSAKDLSFALGALSGTDSNAAARIARTARKLHWLRWAAIAAAVLVTATVTWFLARRAPSEAPLQFAIPMSGEVSHMALSADGSMLAFVSPDGNTGIPTLYVQRIGSPYAQVLPGTEGASYPFWSPNGAYVAFFGKGKLKKIAVSGGPPQALASVAAARGGSWGTRNVIIFSSDSSSSLSRINPDGSDLALATDLDLQAGDQSHRWPVFLPDGNHFLFWSGNFSGANNDRLSGIYVSSLDHTERRLLVPEHSSFAMDSNHIYYMNEERHLVAVNLDPSKATVSGETRVIANSVAFSPSTYWASLTAASNATLIYNTSIASGLSLLTWMDRTGKLLGQIGDAAVQSNPMLSPDGTQVAVDVDDLKANNVDIWLESIAGNGNTRFTFDLAEEVVGVWSRDGKTLAYRSAGGSLGGVIVLLKATNGLEREREIMQAQASDDLIPNSWSLGDRWLLVTRQTPSEYHLELQPVGGGKSVAFQTGRGNQVNGMISPDGNWVAYASDESGNWEIYVTTFPGAAGKWQVSRGEGTEPRWRGDGKEIFYLGPAGMMTAASVDTKGGFSSGTPRPLFQFHGRAPISSTDVFSYDVTMDGKRFLVNRYLKPEKITPLTIVLNAGGRTTD